MSRLHCLRRALSLLWLGLCPLSVTWRPRADRRTRRHLARLWWRRAVVPPEPPEDHCLREDDYEDCGGGEP